MAMRIGSLFSGFGGLDIAVAEFFSGEVVWHAEIDKQACKVLEARWPGVPNLGDIKRVDWEEVARDTPVDVLCGGYPCFPAGTPVLTARGFLPIEEVEVGDQVLTHKNRWRQVTATMSREHEIVEFASGMYATPDHPFWAREPERPIRQYRRHLKEPGFVSASELHGKFAAIPTDYPSLHVPDMPDHRLTWWHIGRWLADGYTSTNNQLFICVGKPKMQRDAPMFDGWTSSEQRTAMKLYLPKGAAVSIWLREHFGRFAHGKKIPAWALGMPEENRRLLLRGYLSGDGHSPKPGVLSAVTVSDCLAVGIRMLATSLGYTTSVHYNRTAPTTVIEGRTVNQRNWWKVAMTEDDGRHTEVRDGHRWMKIRKPARTAGRGIVYDLTVDEDHSFNAWGFVVSNCQGFSHAGLRKGIEDERYLWPYFAAAVRVLRPRHVVLENVAGHVGLGFDRTLADLAEAGFDAEWATVRASDVGAPHRRERLFVLAWDAHRGEQGAGVGVLAGALTEPG